MPENDQPTAKKTLSLTGLTVNAMALIAPGAFLWLTFAQQCLYGQPMAGIAMWFGILVALLLWYQLGTTSRALGWAAFGLILFEWGIARKSLHARLQAYVATTAAFCYMFVGNLDARFERNQMLMTVLPLVVIFYYIYERLYRSRTEAFLQRDTALRAFAWQAAMGTIALGALLRATVPEANVVIAWAAMVTLLMALSAALEPIDAATLLAFLSPSIAASWLFLVVFGSLGAFTIYLRLVRDWGTAKAGMYAFVSPVIAVLVGIALSGETARTSDVLGMGLMLAATWFALGPAQAVEAG